MRNHGLQDRDTCAMFGYNSRLDTIQAVVGNHLLDKIDQIVKPESGTVNIWTLGSDCWKASNFLNAIPTLSGKFTIYTPFEQGRTEGIS